MVGSSCKEEQLAGDADERTITGPGLSKKNQIFLRKPAKP